MKKKYKSIGISLGVCWFIALALLGLILIAPIAFELYMTRFRGFLPDGEAIIMLKKVFLWCFYPSAVFAGIILYSLLNLLYNIRKGEVFIKVNASYLKTVSLCCFAIAIITFIGGFFYMPFMFVSAAGGFVGLLLRVLKNIIQSAIEIREENDLTI